MSKEHEVIDDSEASLGSDSSSDNEEGTTNVKRAFEEIVNKLKKDELDLKDENQRKKFIDRHRSYLDQKTSDDDEKTLLHLLVEDKDKAVDKFQPLVELLIEQYPDLAGVKDSNEKTPFYTAISRKRDRFARLICKNHSDVDSLLNVACHAQGNCIHLAIHKDSKLAEFLIEHASKDTLCSKDNEGRTPLHLAVEYKRCTTVQLKIVKALVQRGDKAIDERTNAGFSAYRYHEHTKQNYKSLSQEGRDEYSELTRNNPVRKDGISTKPSVQSQAKDLEDQRLIQKTRLPNSSLFDSEFKMSHPPGRTN